MTTLTHPRPASGNKRLLRQKNEYRWKPVMEDGIGADKMGSTSFAAVGWGDRGVGVGTVFATGTRDAVTGECWAYGTPAFPQGVPANGEYAIVPAMMPWYRKIPDSAVFRGGFFSLGDGGGCDELVFEPIFGVAYSAGQRSPSLFSVSLCLCVKQKQ